MTEKPKVFVASSVEGLSVAEAVNIKLEFDATVKQWDNAFDLSSITITSLINRAKETDFGVFVLHKDDKATIRENTYSVVRDNVLLELGLFIGALGIERCFVLVPKSASGEFRLPTDLAGVTTTTYDDDLEDMVDAVATSCAKIKQAMKKVIADQGKQESNAPESAIEQVQKQLHSAQSQIWRASNELERVREENVQLLSSIKNHFFSVAKPATETEIKMWEDGAKNSYSENVKINRHSAYFIDRDVVVPSLHGASSISIIVAHGVKLFGIDRWSHNSIYYMDGFRKLD